MISPELVRILEELRNANNQVAASLSHIVDSLRDHTKRIMELEERVRELEQRRG